MFFQRIRFSRFPGWGKSKTKKDNKYNAKPSVVNNTRYDSKAESLRALQLKALFEKGEITDLKEQPRFDIYINNIKVRRYTADFSYIDQNGQYRIEDVKGVQTREFKLVKRIFEAVHIDKGWKIEIVTIKDVSLIP